MTTYKYRIQKAAHTKQVGAKTDYSDQDKKGDTAYLKKKLAEAQALLAEKEQANDVRGVTKMNEIIANLKQTIQGM